LREERRNIFANPAKRIRRHVCKMGKLKFRFQMQREVGLNGTPPVQDSGSRKKAFWWGTKHNRRDRFPVDRLGYTNAGVGAVKASVFEPKRTTRKVSNSQKSYSRRRAGGDHTQEKELHHGDIRHGDGRFDVYFWRKKKGNMRRIRDGAAIKSIALAGLGGPTIQKGGRGGGGRHSREYVSGEGKESKWLPLRYLGWKHSVITRKETVLVKDG